MLNLPVIVRMYPHTPVNRFGPESFGAFRSDSPALSAQPHTAKPTVSKSRLALFDLQRRNITIKTKTPRTLIIILNSFKLLFFLSYQCKTDYAH